jgi:hypothetical protein
VHSDKFQSFLTALKAFCGLLLQADVNEFLHGGREVTGWIKLFEALGLFVEMGHDVFAKGLRAIG